MTPAGIKALEARLAREPDTVDRRQHPHDVPGYRVAQLIRAAHKATVRGMGGQ